MNDYTHNCIKCSVQYKDVDPEPYYCRGCNEERKVIAREVDKKVAARISKRATKSDLQIFDEISRARGSKFINVKDLGITL